MARLFGVCLGILLVSLIPKGRPKDTCLESFGTLAIAWEKECNVKGLSLGKQASSVHFGNALDRCKQVIGNALLEEG